MKTKIKIKAFTLIELIMAMAVSAMITTSILFVFNSGIDSWIFGQAFTEIQETASLCQHKIIEGSFTYDGLREILEITKAEETSITFVPWWEQKVPQIIPEKKIQLKHQVNPMAPLPIGEVWSTQNEQYELVNLIFYSKGDSIEDSKNYIAFPENIQKGSRGRVFFYPEYEKGNKDVEMSIYFNPEKKMLFRSYRGETMPLSRVSEDIMITNFKIEYINGANEVIKPAKLSNLSPMNNPITAIRDIITVKKGDEQYTLRSFVSIRKKGIASEGTLLTEGAQISIPNSRNIKTLSLINFIGVKENSLAYCQISSENENKTYALKINLDLKNNIPWITNYEIEYPRGNVVFSQDINIPASRGLNLLTLDYSGIYDYNADKDIQGQVDFKSDDVKFKLIKSNIRGVSLMQK